MEAKTRHRAAKALPPGQRPLHEHSPQLFSVIIVVLIVHFFIFIKAVKLLAHAIFRLGTMAGTIGGDPNATVMIIIAPLLKKLVLVSVEMAVLSTTFYIFFAICTNRLPLRQGPDWTLLVGGLLIPLAQLCMFFAPLDGFDVEKKNWPAFYTIMLAAGASVGELPLAHLLLQWLFSTPAFM